MSQSNPPHPPPYEPASTGEYQHGLHATSTGPYSSPSGPPPQMQHQGHALPPYPADYSAQAGQQQEKPPAAYGPGYSPSPSHAGAQTPQGGQPQNAPPEQEEGFSLASITKLFSGQSSNPLDPPPPSFNRPVPQWVTSEKFPMMVTLGAGKDLGDGFTAVPPPSALQPHPFQSHDVQDADWVRFLGDIKSAGKLTLTENVRATVMPMAMHVMGPGRLISTLDFITC
ncbi:hypothetical protein OE88DRAFT_1657610 [Heliocybe sulcata]|uniref:Uncharacterized protein n=1 Tax=Heliocybe sulcata TaxID=5364 RepID=A0A5C3N6B3_9AGAM|nr:hypothetical protein OE88DRAFT_1657610 [Heliocybe sulcata]